MAPGVRPSIGSLTVTTVPSPHLLSTLILPPCKFTQRLTITRPRPVPGRSWTLCPRWKGVKKPLSIGIWNADTLISDSAPDFCFSSPDFEMHHPGDIGVLDR